MKVATVEYTGRVRNQSKRAPSGQRYRFGGDRTATVESIDDARHFERAPNFEVELTARGRLMDKISGEVDDIEEAVSELDYNVKRSMASTLGLETDSREESVLEDALTDQAERLKQQMERQR